MANYYSTDYKKILEEEKDALANIKKTQQDAINKIHDNQVADLNNQYAKAVNDTKVAYEGEYARNAVQKLINERQIAEKNANLGLSNSGLNNTQQTAVQLGYAKQKGNIDLAKQNALDTLSQNLAASLSSIQQSRITSISNLDASIDSQAQSNATDRYNANLEANTNIYMADVSKSTESQNNGLNEGKNNPMLYSWMGETSLDDTDSVLLKFIGNDGKSYNVLPGKNPYTDEYNAKISNVVNGKCIIDTEWMQKNQNSTNLIKRACATYGVFSNGYQPKGIFVQTDSGIKDLGKVKSTETYTNVNGKKQTIWYTGSIDNGDYEEWIWDGSINSYRRYLEE